MPRITTKCRSSLALIIGLSIGTNLTAGQEILYVDAHATGPVHNGSSWCDAFTDLQDALGVAAYGDEIRVADGTYTPDGGSGDRTATFQLLNGVALRGGYAGCGADDPDERDIDAYETVLSGDLFDNDGPDFENNVENSYHVVTADGIGAMTILEGFIITAGNANTSIYHDWGGGMCNYNSNPTLANCTFIGNSSHSWGGGMFNGQSSPTMTDCIFAKNWTDNCGGGMHNFGNSNPTLTNCAFIGNSTYAYGGAVYNSGGDQVFTNCIFVGNSAGLGAGGIYNRKNILMLTNCTIAGNWTDHYCGGMYSDPYNSFVKVANCIFWGNSDCDGLLLILA